MSRGVREAPGRRWSSRGLAPGSEQAVPGPSPLTQFLCASQASPLPHPLPHCAIHRRQCYSLSLEHFSSGLNGSTASDHSHYISPVVLPLQPPCSPFTASPRAGVCWGTWPSLLPVPLQRGTEYFPARYENSPGIVWPFSSQGKQLPWFQSKKHRNEPGN